MVPSPFDLEVISIRCSCGERPLQNTAGSSLYPEPWCHGGWSAFCLAEFEKSSSLYDSGTLPHGS